MKVYTTGQVAKICQVAPRTISKWFDSGRLKGYRIPGSADRRIPEMYLITFMKENGFPEQMIPGYKPPEQEFIKNTLTAIENFVEGDPIVILDSYSKAAS